MRQDLKGHSREAYIQKKERELVLGFAYCQKQKRVYYVQAWTCLLLTFLRLAKQNLRLKCAHVVILDDCEVCHSNGGTKALVISWFLFSLSFSFFFLQLHLDIVASQCAATSEPFQGC